MLDKPIRHEERIGPVIYMIMLYEEEDAIKLANDDEFGQGASIWANNRERALRVSEQIERGSVWVNTHHLIDPSRPWEGLQMATGVWENCLEVYQSYTTMRTTFVNLATENESLATDDWFPPVPRGLKHNEMFDDSECVVREVDTERFG